MKNKFLRLISLFIFLFAPAWLAAQVTVVRVKANAVYLDTSTLNRNVAKGETFKIILSTETLTNPKTGKNLGTVYNYSPEGYITEVQPLYAVGHLPNTKQVEIGQEAVLDFGSTPAPATPLPDDKAPVQAAHHAARVFAPVDQEIISVTQADFTAPQAQNLLTLSRKGQVTVWKQDANDTLTQVLSYQLPASKRALTISAATVKPEQVQIFVPMYDSARETISTYILQEENGVLTEIAVIPYFVKELGCGPDKKIYAQKPFIVGSRPGNARELQFKNDKFTPQKTSISTQRNWLTGLTFYPTQEANELLYTARNGVLRLNLAQGKHAESKDLFATAPNRVKYKQEIISFYPSVQAFGTAPSATVAAVENVAKLGILSDTFGQYKNGKIHFLTLEKGRLTVQDTVELDGVIYDTACTDTAILAAEVLPDGTSSVVKIFK